MVSGIEPGAHGILFPQRIFKKNLSPVHGNTLASRLNQQQQPHPLHHQSACSRFVRGSSALSSLVPRNLS